MDDCRCVIFCIFPDKRIFHHRLAQKSFRVSLPDTLIDSVFQYAALKVHLLPNLHKYDCHACVRADGNHVRPGYPHILPKLIQYLLSKGRLFLLRCRPQGTFHIFRKKMVCFYAHFLHRFRHLRKVQYPHIHSSIPQSAALSPPTPPESAFPVSN